MISGVVYQVFLALVIKDEEELFAEFTKYFCCESGGHDPANPCDASKLHTLSHPELASAVAVIGGFFPVVMLVFVLHMKDVKEWCRHVYKCFQ